MLKESTTKVLGEMDELMELAKSQFEMEDILEMDENSRKAVLVMFKLYKSTKELAIAQAEIIDEMNRKLDTLITKQVK